VRDWLFLVVKVEGVYFIYLNYFRFHVEFECVSLHLVRNKGKNCNSVIFHRVSKGGCELDLTVIIQTINQLGLITLD